MSEKSDPKTIMGVFLSQFEALTVVLAEPWVAEEINRQFDTPCSLLDAFEDENEVSTF